MVIIMCIAAGILWAIFGFWAVPIVYIAYYAGVFGWAQIIGSFQHIHERSAGETFATILIWLILLGGLTALVYFVLSKFFIACLVGLSVSLLQMLFIGRIE